MVTDLDMSDLSPEARALADSLSPAQEALLAAWLDHEEAERAEASLY